MTEDSSPQTEPQVAHAPLAGVIGWPIAHSRSPLLHGHWLRRYGLPGYYIPIPVRPENLAEVLHSLPRMGFVGVNVTIPHKEAVLQITDIVTTEAGLIEKFKATPIAFHTAADFKPDGLIAEFDKLWLPKAPQIAELRAVGGKL